MMVSLARWMEEALYDPTQGYYTRNISTVGRGGDFSTAVTLSPVIGQAVWSWVREESNYHRGRVLHAIEIGAGDGALMQAVLSSRGWRERWMLRKKNCVHFHIVERSPALEHLQKTRLRNLGVTWHQSMEAALAACGGRAFIFSNELVDAFPVVQVRWSGSCWEEVCLDIATDPPREVMRKYCGSEEPTDLPLWPGPPRAGHRVERHFSYRDWLASWLPKLQSGSLLTIDYGGEFPELPCRRPGGTLRGYLRHQRVEGSDVYLNKGKQDLTADVNFSDLQRWGEEFGLENLPLETQREFLLRSRSQLDACLDPAVQAVLHPDGAGTAFKVLRQRKTSSTT